jgi:5'-3' exonuclease
MSDGCEADDLLGIEQTANNENGVESCIISIDKDLDCISGWHFNPGIRRGGVFIKEPRRYLVSPRDATRFFYTQLLVGDPTDGIKGAPGIGKVKAEKILQHCETEWELYQACLDYFSCEEELIQNARCVYIQHYENEVWSPPAGPMDSSEETQLHSERAEAGDKTLAT